jgi:hypothetical protein
VTAPCGATMNLFGFALPQTVFCDSGDNISPHDTSDVSHSCRTNPIACLHHFAGVGTRHIYQPNSVKETPRMELEFYLVWRENTPATTCRHATYYQAKTGAERLAIANPGVRFFVLTARDFALCARPVTWGKLDEVPF